MQIRLDPFEDAYEVYKEEILGSGQFAIVKKCRDKKTNRNHAAKFVIKRRPNSSSRKGLFREKILQEIEILSELKHDNIIQLHDVFETQTEIIIVLELVSGGELFEFLSEKDHLNESEAAEFITQILEGVEHFHARNVVHLDLKPENVMLYDRQSLKIKIIDFGISRKLKPGEKVMETYGTPEFVGKYKNISKIFLFIKFKINLIFLFF
jgi:serine/threonine protein kinase